MSRILVRQTLAVLVSAAVTWPLGAQQPGAAVASRWQRREVMLPMRDGVRLYTVVMIPRDAPGPLPILLTRTPYGANGWGETDRVPGTYRELAADGYVFAFQDIRGRNRSEGRFLMNRPLRPHGDTTGVDEATDAWDAVDWLVKNVANNNGRVGIFGVSYPGWLAEVPLVYPHPALRAVSPQAPMTDTWMGDDFFHQGAFRMSYGFEYSWGMEGRAAGLGQLPIDRPDAYDWYLSFPSLADLTERTGALRLPTWRHFVEHPAYDSVWQNRAFERAVRGVSVPTLTVGGWWDQEDIYGPTATYAALEHYDTAGVNALVMGPWSHGQWARLRGGDSLGNIGFAGATSDSFRVHIQAPWFRYWLRGQGSGRFPDAQLYDAGTDRWRAFDRWPPARAVHRSLFLRADHRLSFDPPTERSGFDAYVSDPANPVPYRPRPVEVTYSQGSRWARWMTEDQRFVSDRADVLSWTTEPLKEDVVIAGPVEARLFAATTGSDADWVVKLIDVYPDSGVAESMRGYQLMIAGEILRGRYRRSFERPEPIPPNVVEAYTVDLHPQFHTFRRGHRIQVQVQSSWFPLYDRNPQTFVPNIFEAPASAYLPRAHRIVRTADESSRVDVMVLPR